MAGLGVGSRLPATPLPLRSLERGLPTALSVIVRTPDFEFADIGLKLTATVTLEPAGTLCGKFAGVANSPVQFVLVMANSIVVGFVIATDFVTVVPTITSPKSSRSGEALTCVHFVVSE